MLCNTLVLYSASFAVQRSGAVLHEACNTAQVWYTAPAPAAAPALLDMGQHKLCIWPHSCIAQENLVFKGKVVGGGEEKAQTIIHGCAVFKKDVSEIRNSLHCSVHCKCLHVQMCGGGQEPPGPGPLTEVI